MPFVRPLGLLAFSFLCVSTFAKSNCEELNDLWRSKFYKDFNVEWKFDVFQCPSADATMAKAIYDVYKPSLGFDFYGWASGLVKKMYFTSSCDKGVVATMRSDGVMKICPGFYKDQEVSRAGTIVHEAAHAEKGDEGHVTCAHGSSRGSRACDRRLNESGGGSGYNREFIYLSALYMHSDYSGLDRELIRYTLKFMVANRFNEVSSEQMKKWSSLSRTSFTVDDSLGTFDASELQNPDFNVKSALASLSNAFQDGEQRSNLAQNVLKASGSSLALSIVKNHVLELLLEEGGTDLSLIVTVSKLAREEKDLSLVRSALQWLKKVDEREFESVKLIRSKEGQAFFSDI